MLLQVHVEVIVIYLILAPLDCICFNKEDVFSIAFMAIGT